MIRTLVLNALTLAADPQTKTAQVWLWWLRDAIAPSFDPVTDDDLLEALITLDDAGAISLYDDPHGQTWYRLNQRQQPPTSPPADLRHLAWPPVPTRSPSPQTAAERAHFEPGDEPERTRGSRSLREGESAGGRERASASDAASPPEVFCPEHRPNGAGFDQLGRYIDCRSCGDYRMVFEAWMIKHGYRKPRK